MALVVVLTGVEAYGATDVEGALAESVWFVTGASLITWGLVTVFLAWRKNDVPRLQRGLALAATVFLSMAGSAAIHSIKEGRSISRGDELCNALIAHEERTGRFPDALDQLVPDDLATVPTTALGVFMSPEFTYVRHDAASEGESDFTLRFHTSSFGVMTRTARTPWRWHD